MTGELNAECRARLYLDAVLPCLCDLVEQDPGAHAAIAGWEEAIRFRVVGGPVATLRIAGGKVEHSGDGRGRATIELLFLNVAHLNAFFGGAKWAVPIPVWGGWKIGRLSAFTRLTDGMEALLKPDAAVLADAEKRRLFTRMTLITAGLGLRWLAELDGASREILTSLPWGMAEFRIEGEGLSVWFENAERARAGVGAPPRVADAVIRFIDREVAFTSLRDEADTLAEVGLGRILVEGLVPLADGLNAVMERLRAYLEP